jgi:hypothetical protein
MRIRNDDGPGGLLHKTLSEGFSVKNDLCPRMYSYRDRRFVSKAYYNLVVPLIDAGIFVRVDGRIKFSDMMTSLDKNTGKADYEHTKNLINVVNNVKMKIDRTGGEMLVLRRVIPAGARSLVRETLRLNAADHVYGQIKGPEAAQEAQTIRIWQGYGANNQLAMMQNVEKRTNNRIEFEKDINMLVELAVRPENMNKGTVTILPREKLSPEQRKLLAGMAKHGAQIIYIDLNKENLLADELGQVEGLIGLGRSYLNNDEESFYRLYNLLVDNPAGGYVSLNELRAHPDLFIERLKFILRSIISHNYSERDSLRRCQETLLESA